MNFSTALKLLQVAHQSRKCATTSWVTDPLNPSYHTTMACIHCFYNDILLAWHTNLLQKLGSQKIPCCGGLKNSILWNLLRDRQVSLYRFDALFMWLKSVHLQREYKLPTKCFRRKTQFILLSTTAWCQYGKENAFPNCKTGVKTMTEFYPVWKEQQTELIATGSHRVFQAARHKVPIPARVRQFLIWYIVYI